MKLLLDYQGEEITSLKQPSKPRKKLVFRSNGKDTSTSRDKFKITEKLLKSLQSQTERHDEIATSVSRT